MSGKKRWEKERAAVAAVQVAFDLGVETQTRIKKRALDEQLHPSEFIRKILGLHYKAKPVRPRLTLSLSDEDFAQLAEQWGLDAQERLKIKEIAAQKLLEYAHRMSRNQ